MSRYGLLSSRCDWPHRLELIPTSLCLFSPQYDTRKSAALDLQRLLRQCLTSTLPSDQARITQIIDQSRSLLSTENTSTTRNGGLLALAGAAIALGEEIVPYFGRIIEPVLECFGDPDNRIRYFAVECVVRLPPPCSLEATSGHDGVLTGS